ncbi:MAG: rhamnulose-1-phosphate aldolase, partial [Asgard group archaeon]|nr:rhamnulose-1-phosphate aldolase [Asgard group archaeon]
RLVLWENHGIIATEVTFEECFDLIDIANKAAKIYLLTAPLKENPKLFTDQQLQTIKDKYLPKK